MQTWIPRGAVIGAAMALLLSLLAVVEDQSMRSPGLPVLISPSPQPGTVITGTALVVAAANGASAAHPGYTGYAFGSTGTQVWMPSSDTGLLVATLGGLVAVLAVLLGLAILALWLPTGSQRDDASGLTLADRWLKLADECAFLYDELDELQPHLDAGGRQLADHVCLRLREILERRGVQVIAGDTTFDHNRHQPSGPLEHAITGAPVADTTSPGFAVGRRVLRRARVRLAADQVAQQAEDTETCKQT